MQYGDYTDEDRLGDAEDFGGYWAGDEPFFQPASLPLNWQQMNPGQTFSFRHQSEQSAMRQGMPFFEPSGPEDAPYPESWAEQRGMSDTTFSGNPTPQEQERKNFERQWGA